MAALNGSLHAVTVLSPTQFTIGDTSGMGAHTAGGVVAQLPRKRQAYTSHTIFDDFIAA